MDIQVQSTIVGEIRFGEDRPSTRRTLNGFLIELPIRIRLRPTPSKRLIPMLSGLRGSLYFHDEVADEAGLEVGQLGSDQTFIGGSSDYEAPATLAWRGSSASLVAHERIRGSRAPSWRVRLAGEIHLLDQVPNEPLQLRDAPQTFHGTEELSLAAEIWTETLRKLGIMDFLLVQIPFPSAALAPMEPVLRSIQMAREDFAVGGRTGWQACGIHVRQALTDWNSAEPLDVGKGVSDKTKLTKDQRLDRLREALREFTHIAGHQEPSIAREWTRDDALLALSGICALVNAKKP